MESQDNHEIKYKYMQKLFTIGHQFSQQGLKEALLTDYLERLGKKDGEKE